MSERAARPGIVKRRGWLVILGVWTVFGLIAASQQYLFATLQGESIAVWRSVVLGLATGWFYALATPLILTGLAVAVAFRAKFWNIGAEGQLLAGAMAAAFIGERTSLPGFALDPFMILCGAAAGAAWALLPAILRTRFKVDDVVTTLLLNFVIFYGMTALLDGPWKDPLSGYPDSPDIRPEAEFPVLLPGMRLHLGILIAVVAAALVWFVMNRTVLGFAIKAVGENPRAAAYAGLPIGRVLLSAAAISGALAGLAGVGEVGGVHFQVMADLSPGYGYTGIVIAMLAGLSPVAVVPAADASGPGQIKKTG
jgi:simple sugar transport system permease protein